MSSSILLILSKAGDFRSIDTWKHGLIYYIDTKAKVSSSKKVFFWRYSQSCLYFRPSSVNCCPSNLLSGSTLPPSPFPLPCVNKYIVYTYTVYWGDGVLGLRQINICRRVSLWVSFLDDDILHCFLWVFFFLRLKVMQYRLCAKCSSTLVDFHFSFLKGMVSRHGYFVCTFWCIFACI